MIFLFIITMILCLILFAERLTGPIVHIICGVLLAICCVKHMLLRMVRMKGSGLTVRLVDEVLLAALLIVIVSGMLMHPFSNVLWIGILHKLSGVVFFLGMIAHVIQHYKINQ